MRLKASPLSFSVLATIITSSSAFQIRNPQQIQKYETSTKLFSTGTLVSMERSTKREIEQFQEWAGSCGAQWENGFCLQEQMADGNEDYFAATSTGAAQGSCVLYVPAGMILSSANIAQEYEGYVDAPLRILNMMGPSLYHQFMLFLKILVEYEKGDESPYRPWLEALPRKWNTAASMDEFCISQLPPYLKSLCMIERNRLDIFRQSLGAFQYVTPETKANADAVRFAYNVAFTRSWQSDDGDYRIVPVADMLNHDYPDNAVLTYDESGGCAVYVKEDVAPGAALTLSYGNPANPSRFLATYGFLNDAQAAFCKKLIISPSQELKDIGYDPDRMLFYTADGSISQEVWDVFLFSMLEKNPDLANVKDAFYQAHMTGDEQTKGAIHSQYQQDTVGALLQHVNQMLNEVHEQTVKMNSHDSVKHPRIPLLKKHHAMVTSTFTKVREYLLSIQE